MFGLGEFVAGWRTVFLRLFWTLTLQKKHFAHVVNLHP